MTIRSRLALGLLGALAMVAAPAAAPPRQRVDTDEDPAPKPKPKSEPIEVRREAHPIVPPYTPTRPRAPDYDKVAKLARRDIRRAERAAKDGSLLKKVPS